VSRGAADGRQARSPLTGFAIDAKDDLLHQHFAEEVRDQHGLQRNEDLVEQARQVNEVLQVLVIGPQVEQEGDQQDAA
jgi:hypothetical protein